LPLMVLLHHKDRVSRRPEQTGGGGVTSSQTSVLGV
jgi:hypothetical protein